MAGNGPAPAERRQRKDKTPQRDRLSAPKELMGPDLPEIETIMYEFENGLKVAVIPKEMLGGDDYVPYKAYVQTNGWHPRTHAWWEAWRAAPQAKKMFTDPDWDFLLDTAVLHHAMWHLGETRHAAEIRLRVAKFGATYEDRQRLAMTVDEPAQKYTSASSKAGNVTNISDRKKRLVAE